MDAVLALHNELIEARATLKTAKEVRDKANSALEVASRRYEQASRAAYMALGKVERYVAALVALGVEVPPEENTHA